MSLTVFLKSSFMISQITQNEARVGVMRLIVGGGRATEDSESKGSVIVGVRTLSEGGCVGNFSREQVYSTYMGSNFYHDSVVCTSLHLLYLHTSTRTPSRHRERDILVTFHLLNLNSNICSIVLIIGWLFSYFIEVHGYWFQVELFCVNNLINCSLESNEEFIFMEFRFALRDNGMRAAFQLLHMVLEVCLFILLYVILTCHIVEN